MGRARARMAMISSKKARRMTFEKRGRSLKKKAYELSTLCGLEVCLITFFPRDSDEPIEPKSWPENSQEIRSLIQSFNKLRADDGRCKITDPSSYFKDRTKKADGDLAKLRKKNLQAKFPTWDKMYEDLSEEEMRKLGGLLKAKLKAMKYRVDFMKGIPTFSTETSGNVMMNSLCEHERSPYQNPSYMIQNQNFSNRTTNSMELEFLQLQHSSTLHSNVHGVQVSIPMANPQWLTQQHTVPNQFPPLMDSGASISNAIVFHNTSPAQYNLEPLEHIGATVDIGDETARCYCVPAMQQVPSELLHFLPSGSPTEMNTPKTSEFSTYESKLK